MIFTQSEKAKVKQKKLRPFCLNTDNRYLCKVKIGNKIKVLNKHDTIEECNAQWDSKMNEMANQSVT